MYTDESINEENREDYENNYDDQSNKSYDSSSRTKIIFIIALVVILIILIILVLTKNKGGFGKKDNYVLNIDPPTIVIPYGESKVINNDEILNNAIVNLTVENEDVVALNNNSITGLNYGKSILVATYTDSEGNTIQKIVEITVADGDPNTPISNVQFPEGDLQMPVNSTYDIPIVIDPSSGYVESKKFRSSNNNIITVDNTGKITSLAEGEATVKIDINNGVFSSNLKVYVNNKSQVPAIIINPSFDFSYSLAFLMLIRLILFGQVQILVY